MPFRHIAQLKRTFIFSEEHDFYYSLVLQYKHFLLQPTVTESLRTNGLV